MFSADWQMATWVPYALDWITVANDQTGGLLDIVLGLLVVGSLVLGLFLYLNAGSIDE